jgi:hypothetical protein
MSVEATFARRWDVRVVADAVSQEHVFQFDAPASFVVRKGAGLDRSVKGWFGPPVIVSRVLSEPGTERGEAEARRR